jgi:ribonuclease D
MTMPIADAAALAARLSAFAGSGAVGVDTEFLRERTYYAQLCLVQLCADAECLCIDTLALPELSPLQALMSNAGIVKVLHAARQDLEVLWPAAGPVRNVYDTQVAAALTGLAPQVGYAELVSRLLQVQLQKAHTRTDWSRRPLSAEQLDYALDDVRYLLPLRAALDQRLRELGRTDCSPRNAGRGEANDYAIDPERAGGSRASELDAIAAASAAAGRVARNAPSAQSAAWLVAARPAARHRAARARTAAELAGIQELPGYHNNSGAQRCSWWPKRRYRIRLSAAAPTPDDAWINSSTGWQRLPNRRPRTELAPEMPRPGVNWSSSPAASAMGPLQAGAAR